MVCVRHEPASPWPRCQYASIRRKKETNLTGDPTVEKRVCIKDQQADKRASGNEKKHSQGGRRVGYRQLGEEDESQSRNENKSQKRKERYSGGEEVSESNPVGRLANVQASTSSVISTKCERWKKETNLYIAVQRPKHLSAPRANQ